MKLQLSAGDISQLLSGIESTGDSVEDAKRVFRALQDFGLDTITGRDFRALWVKGLGWKMTRPSDGGDWPR